MPDRDETLTGVHEARLELLATFNAVFSARSVTAAARALGQSQPTVSKHLSRLRVWFGDELFVRTPSGMEPTERAEAMASGVARILREVADLSERQVFRPGVLRGPMVVAAPDELLNSLAPRLLPTLAAHAPELRLTFHNPEPQALLRELELGDLHCAFVHGGLQHNSIRQRFVFADPLVCVMRANHPLASGRLTPQRYASAAHLAITALCRTCESIDVALAQQGLDRFVRVTVPTFAAAVELLRHSDLIAALPLRAARLLAARNELVQLELPVSSADVPYFLCWHQRYEQDPGHGWLRRILGKCALPSDAELDRGGLAAALQQSVR